MHPDISEFSFGFALTSELVHLYDFAFIGAPRFPTQNEEGAIGGYDVALPRRGVPLLLQFKRSERMVRRRSPESYILGVPHFRFHLRPSRHSDQHELLRQQEADGNEVYYAAPRFDTYDELNAAYLANEVADRSTLIEPSKIGSLPDNGDHHVAIARDNSDWRFCSREPKPLDAVPSKVILHEKLKAGVRQKARRIDSRFLLELGDRMVARFVEAAPKYRQDERAKASAIRLERSPGTYAREVANMLYGCELLFSLVD